MTEIERGVSSRAVVAAVLVLAWRASAACGQFVSGPAADTQATSATSSAQALPLPVEQAAARLHEVLQFWDVLYVETTPHVNVGDWAGHRVMLRQVWQDWVGCGQSGLGGRPVARRADVQFVLFPLAGGTPRSDVKLRIRWRTRFPGVYTRPVNLGTGLGYVWLADAPLYLQHVAREGLGLSGGDDSIQLLIDGLFVNDRGSMTRNSVMPLIPSCGNRALPYLERAIARATDNDVWAPVSVLAQIPGERSTPILVGLFESSNEARRRAAAVALTRDPQSEIGKRAYFELLRRQWCPESAAAACAKYGWSDALPILDEIITHPTSRFALRSALEARRRLRGEPVPENLLAAEATLRRLVSGMPTTRPTATESDAARTAILNSPDIEYAIVVAIDLALYGCKGGAPVTDAGRALLRSLSPVPTRQRLQMLAAESSDASDRREFEELLASLNPPAPH